MDRVKLEGSDIWEMMPVPTEEERNAAERRHNSALEGVREIIIKNISSIRLFACFEDGQEEATMTDLSLAVDTARTEDLEDFISSKGKDHYLPFEDGYILAIF